MKDCTTCKYGFVDEQLGFPMCHHPKRFSEDCVDFNMHEEIEEPKKATGIEEKKLPEGLEEAAEESWVDYEYREHPQGLYASCYQDGFVAGAEYQRKQDQSLIELAEEHAMLAGMNKMEQQMLEKAVEIEVKEDAGGFPIVPLDAIELYDYENDKPLAKAGDKVRMIVLKAEEE